VSRAAQLAAGFSAQVLGRRISALQQRAVQHSGAARQAIEARLLQLRQASSLANAEDPAVAAPADRLSDRLSDRVSPLAALVAHMARQQPPAGELKTVRDHRGTWAQLGVQQRLTQTLAQVPDNAGPLNTQRLMHQALSLMGETSPAYLQHFMAHVEALLALDQLSPPPAALPAGRARKDGARPTRGG
jgi:hypothetical protein